MKLHKTIAEDIMAFHIQRINYYHVNVADLPGSAYRLLSQLAGLGVNLSAFNAVPIGPMHTQLSIFSPDGDILVREAEKASLKLDGPYPAILVQGDDELGALAQIHEKLYKANVNVYASSGVSDGEGAFGYLLYVRPEQYELAAEVFGI